MAVILPMISTLFPSNLQRLKIVHIEVHSENFSVVLARSGLAERLKLIVSRESSAKTFWNHKVVDKTKECSGWFWRVVLCHASFVINFFVFNVCHVNFVILKIQYFPLWTVFLTHVLILSFNPNYDNSSAKRTKSRWTVCIQLFWRTSRFNICAIRRVCDNPYFVWPSSKFSSPRTL